MPALAHIGVGLATKHLAPRLSVWILMIGAMVIDIVAIFTPLTWMSHGLIMAIIWTLISMVITAATTKLLHSKKDQDIGKLHSIRHVTLIMGLLVFSHWVLDFIGWPMTVFKPDWTGVPILLDNTLTIGLGVYSTWLGALSMDIGVFIAGLLIYLKARKVK